MHRRDIRCIPPQRIAAFYCSDAVAFDRSAIVAFHCSDVVAFEAAASWASGDES